MRLETRQLLDKCFSGIGMFSIFLMGTALVAILAPMLFKGLDAFVFKGTVEYRRLMMEQFDRGNAAVLNAEIRGSNEARKPVYEMILAFEKELESAEPARRRKYLKPFKTFRKDLETLLGPEPGVSRPILVREQFGQTRWDRSMAKLDIVMNSETWDYSDPTKKGIKIKKPRAEDFTGTALEPAFPYISANIEKMLLPKRTFYWQFLTDVPVDAHMFGGIWPELLGTLYLTIGAMIFAIPMGIIAAIYLTEYAVETRLINLLRTCISTLAGVPSIVFGLFGLAFFINTIKVSPSKSVLAGSMTLALMILPTIIRSAEEAIKAVPRTYKEAALSLGASRWHTVLTVILPAALPGILTGIVISMGRAAGETAPIIFTAVASVGKPLHLSEVFTEQTPALSWNIYNIATEHVAVDEIRHVQFGMVFVLVGIVLLLNMTAIFLRARISHKLKG